MNSKLAGPQEFYIKLFRDNDPEPFEMHKGTGNCKKIAKLDAISKFLETTSLSKPASIVKREKSKI